MSKYSVKEVREAASATIGKVRGMLTAYADLLEQIERAREGVSDAEIMAEWFKADGSVHGPNVETVTMPQAKYLAFRRSVAHLLPSGEPPSRPPIIVPPYVSADDANRLYGERFGMDWKYEAITADTFRKLHPPAQAAQVDEYAAGWRQAARWAERDDLLADIGSPAYERDKSFVLQDATTKPMAQATTCAGCGKHKPTPLRIDAMGGYVCLTCIDEKLSSLLGEFGYPPAEPVAQGDADIPNERDDLALQLIEVTEERDHLRAVLAAQPRAMLETWRPMETVPRDGTMLRLLVQFEDHATEDTTEPAPTIGAYEEGADGWQFAGWCWSHDHFTEGKGTPIGWLPMLADVAAPVGVPDGFFVAPLLKPDEMQALRRFAETTEDDESYDVPRDMMTFLSLNGAVTRSATKKDWFWLTDYGRMLLAAAPSPGESQA